MSDDAECDLESCDVCFLAKLYELSKLPEEEDQRVLELAIGGYEGRLREGRFGRCDLLLKITDIALVAPLALLGILTITSHGKDKLPSRPDFVERAEKVILKHYGEKRGNSLLRNRR